MLAKDTPIGGVRMMACVETPEGPAWMPVVEGTGGSSGFTPGGTAKPVDNSRVVLPKYLVWDGKKNGEANQ